MDKYSGVELLQIYANNTGYSASIFINACAYCWVKGVFDNYADADHIDVYYSYRDEIRDSYFSNAYSHSPGGADSDIDVMFKSSGLLIENNILERLHAGNMLNHGSAGNVVGYNYEIGNFDSSANYVTMAMLDNHGAHPQFNLYEGNIGNEWWADSFWGSGSNNTAFRNLFRATDTIATPYTGRSAVQWSSAYLANQQNRGFQIDFPHTNENLIGNIEGSADAVSAVGSANLYHSGPSVCTACEVPPATRYYGCGVDQCEFEAITIGYDTGSDSSGSDVTTFAGGPNNTAGYWVGLAWQSAFLHGNWDIASQTTIWNVHKTESQTLPASFYKSSQPSWWATKYGTPPWPAIGPDVTGGNLDTSTLAGHANANPAMTCYNNTARDSNGLKLFDPTVCYPGSFSSGPAPDPATNLIAVPH
jgi:hypothetical protein